MRRLGPLLLVVIVAIVAAVAVAYRSRKASQQRSAPAIPESLPSQTSAAARDWCWSQTQLHRTVAEVCAKNFRQLKDPSRLHLDGVEVKVYAGDGATFDRIRTASAELDTGTRTFLAGGEVEITMGEPVGQRTAPRRVFIRTSGLKYEVETGRASTIGPTAFRFDRGEGSSLGALYDPEYRELHLRSQTEVTWRGSDPKSKPLKVETDELIYKERDSAIIVGPWCRLSRGEMSVTGGKGILWLKEGDIRRVEASQASGTDRPGPDRLVEYAADQVFIDFAAGGEVERIAAERNARLASIEKASRISATAGHIDLDFDLAGGESRLRKALARGGAVVESVPAGDGNTPAPPARVLRSDIIELAMRPGGREIDTAETRAPGVIEFLPAAPSHSRRRLEASRISIDYAGDNRLRSLQASEAATRTEPPRPAGKPAPPPLLTWSRDLRAEFDPASSELARLEQWGDFRYEEGGRRGRAGRAVFDLRENLITLVNGARVWDAEGSLAADRIVMSQQSGDVAAEGSVASTREPERDQQPGALVSPGEPLYATAARMLLSMSGRRIRYDGDAVVWQGASRTEAGWIEIDRGERTLEARGNVHSRFVELGAAPVFTLVDAHELRYTDNDRTAVYRGGVLMRRSGMNVSAAGLRAVFAVKNRSSELESAYADGNVRITHVSGSRTREATAEHAEYAVAEGRVALSGGSPQFTDSLRGSTRGRQLTWYAGNDRLLVDGRQEQPAVSVIRRQ